MKITKQNGAATVTMTSLELVEYINSQRAEGDAVLAHSDFLKKVPQVLGEKVAGNFSGYYKATNGKQNPMYTFPKREACLMAMSYSYDIQAKVFDRMTELEEREKNLGLRKTSINATSNNGLAEFRKAKALQMAEETAAKVCARFSKLGESAQQVIYAKIINPIAGTDVLMLPKVEEKLKMAGEVGELLGVSGNMIGRIANRLGLKTSEYGEFRLDKSEYSAKQVEVFCYNGKAVDKIREVLAEESKEAA